MTLTRHLLRAVLFGAVLSWAAVLTAAESDPKKTYDLAAGEAATTLKQFSAISGRETLFAADAVRGVKTPPVKGTLSAQEAVDALLTDTGLVAVRDEKTGAFAIRKETPDESKNVASRPAEVATAPAPMRVAKRGKDGDVFQLDEYRVSADRLNPFADGNLDIPRTVNDVQPYYVFDSTTISNSGTTNLEDFLRERVTMNALAMSQLQGTGSAQINTITGGRQSQVDLRGLGADKTVVLINGRRTSAGNQADVNAIPMGLVDRIEVLPAAASAIYGGNAIGGVVNIILKRNYNNTRLNLRYEFSGGASDETRKADLYSGFTIEGGRTQVQIQLSNYDGKPLYLRDRQDLYYQRINQIRANNPTYFNSATTAILGVLPNIIATSGSTLTLDNDVVINSPMTFVPAGTSASTSLADLYAGLAANGGKISTDLADTNQRVGGLRRPLTSVSRLKTGSLSVEREMTKNIRLRAEFTYQPLDYTTQTANALIAFPLSASSPANPFKQAISIAIPINADLPVVVKSLQRSFSLGAILKLPAHLQGTIDFYRGISTGDFNIALMQTPANASHPIVADINAGVFNPFVDLSRYPYSFDKYILHYRNTQDTSFNDRFNFRVNGPVSVLPTGDLYLTFGGEHAITRTGESRTVFPAGTLVQSSTQFARKDYQSAVFGEVTFPLLTAGRHKWVDALEMQVAGRITQSKTQTGTSGLTVASLTSGVELFRSYSGTLLPDGSPYTDFTSYKQSNFTTGFKYSPVHDLSFRVSASTAFLPPFPSQLSAQAQGAVPTTANITDPKFPADGLYSVNVITGGNPNLKPQSSTSYQSGVVWTPSIKVLKGLRLNIEYWENEQENAISSLSAQQLVNFESSFPDNITRGANGRVTQVDTRYMNLFNRRAKGIDYSLNFQRQLNNHDYVNVSVSHSTALQLRTQYAVNQPAYDAVNFPSEGGAVKYRSNANLTWRHDQWRLTWATQRIGSYKIGGAAGGPSSLQNANGGVVTPNTTVIAQGGDTVPSQIYHDLTLGYATGERASGHRWRDRLLSNIVVTFGVRNVFDKVPPLDVSYTGNFYTSPFVGLRLRNYWIELSKSF